MPAVTLVVGDEELLVGRAIGRVVAAARERDGADVPVHEVVGGELTVDELAELTSPSLFGDVRVVVVRAVQDAAKDVVDALAAHAADGGDEIAIVAVHAGGAKGKAILDVLKGAGAHLVAAPRVKKSNEREAFVADEVGQAGGVISRDAVVDLIAAVGTDLRELATAAAQLVSDVGGQVETTDVAAYYRGRAESTGYAVADRAVEGDVSGALETLRWAFATGMDPVLVSAALAANLRTIAVVGAAGRARPDDLAGPLGMPAWKIRRAQGWLKRWKPAALADAVRAVAAADANIKGEGADAAYAAETAVMTVAACATR